MEQYFRLIEATTLLDMPPAEAILITENLKDHQNQDFVDVNACKETLAEFDITILSPSVALKILQRRVNLLNV